ncbi:DUF1206 domain-containing protein [Nocardioides sp. J54]|uniref:DUF1206 domain-containing protein n=1 Tax=Nocardioides sp. J54 TaxID=935866 RepID=UPI0004B2477D|nr:DUF1206 domain-containing protein [Nocardioides sp. J54]
MTAPGEAAQRKAQQAQDHPVLDRLARVGMVTYGVVYLLVGWLAAQLALGDPSGSASGAGALQEIAEKPLGSLALWLVALGMSALAVWQACEAVGGHGDEDGLRRWAGRAGSAGRTVVFASLAVLAVRTALGDGGSSGGSGGGGGQGVTAKVLDLPFGPAIVLLAAAVVLGVAAASAYRGLSDRWEKDVEVEGRTGDVGRVVTILARAGYVSRGVAFGVIAFLLARAAVEHDPDESGGLDQAIVKFRDEPLGPWLIAVVAVGLACFGAYHLFRAWYLRSR